MFALGHLLKQLNNHRSVEERRIAPTCFVNDNLTRLQESKMDRVYINVMWFACRMFGPHKTRVVPPQGCVTGIPITSTPLMSRNGVKILWQLFKKKKRKKNCLAPSSVPFGFSEIKRGRRFSVQFRSVVGGWRVTWALYYKSFD